MSNPESQRLLARYLAGLAGPEEEQQARRILAEDASLRRRLEGLPPRSEEVGIDFFTTTRPAGSGLSPGPPLKLVAAADRSDPTQTDSGPRPTPRSGRPTLRLVRWAAAIAAAVAVVWVMLPRQEALPPAMVLSTAPGERHEFELSDGTLIELGVASRLEVAEGFGKTGRFVRLEGQAHFDVAHDADRPFDIEVGPARVTVVGTTFGVRSYREEDLVSVAVTSGRVDLQARASTRRHQLRAGQAADLRKSDVGQAWVERELDVDRDFSWRNDRLVFRGTALSAIAEDLERSYGIFVRFDDDRLKSLRLDATFEKEPIDRVARTIGLALNLDAALLNDTLVFRAHR